jgi:hypothetical protein
VGKFIPAQSQKLFEPVGKRFVEFSLKTNKKIEALSPLRIATILAIHLLYNCCKRMAPWHSFFIVQILHLFIFLLSFIDQKSPDF